MTKDNAVKAYKAAAVSSNTEELVLAHLSFVRHIVSRYFSQLPVGVDIENLESAGMLGLVEAAQQFDPARGVSFKHFAFRRIKGAIIDELRRNCPLPQKMLQQIARIRQVLETMEPPVHPETLAKAVNLSTEELDRCLEAMRMTRIGLWDDSLSSGKGVIQNREQDPEEAVMTREALAVVSDCIEKLPRQERLVLTMYYVEDLRLKEIGEVLKLSESRVSRILSKALFRLRELARERGI